MRKSGLAAVLLAIYIIVFFLAFSCGRYPVGPIELVKILLSRIIDINADWPVQAESVVFSIRLPRIIASSLIGAGLALSGLVFQTIFRNPMVSPDVLGASAGAGAGAAAAILLGLGSAGITAMSFAMGLLAVLAVWLIGSRLHDNHVLGLVLGGIMVSSLFQSATSFVKLVADTEETLPAITYFLMGSLAGIGTMELKAIAMPIMLPAALMLLLSWRIGLLALSEEEAMSLGVNIRLIRFLAVLSSTLMTASSVAVSGMIGWVGLVIPHIARMTAGSDTRRAFPASMLLGAAFLTATDTISRSVTTSEIPIGILTSFIGAPFFLYLIIREGRKEWQ